MQKLFINEFKEGMTLESTFLCSHKAMLTDKNGKPYLNLRLLDRTGSIEARLWDKAPHWEKKFEKLDYVQVKGNVTSFQDHLQLNVIAISRIEESSVDPGYFLPHSQKDIPQMYAELIAICKADMKNPWIQQLMLNILQDEKMAPAFQQSPAAKSNHHAWIGGLLEHVLHLCKLAKDVLKHYPQIDQDLVLAGMIMHDFGKIEELLWKRHFEYSDRGKLIGHLIISVEILLKQAARIPDFPEKVLWHLEHIILSHHGKLEYGSPKEPMTLEALVVHSLDNMDSKIQGFLDVLARETNADPTWSSDNFVFKRSLYKRTRSDMEESIADTSAAPQAPAPPAANPSPPRGQKKAGPEKAPVKKTQMRGPLKTNLGELLSEKLKEGTS